MTAPARALVHDRTHLDWITVTHDSEAELRELLRGPVVQRAVGLGNYPVSYEDGHGALLACGGLGTRPFQLRMTGKVLDAWRAEATDRELINHLAFIGAHCTRIDIARDTAGPRTPYWLLRYLKEGRYVSRWRGFSQESGIDGQGLTVKCGSRASDVYMRVYDKRAQMELRGEA